MAYLVSTSLGSSDNDFFTSYGTHEYLTNDWNYVKGTFDGSYYRYYYSTDGQTWELDYEHQSSTPLVNFTSDTCIGYNNGTSRAFNGEIDLTVSYIKIGDTTTTFGTLSSNLYNSNLQAITPLPAPEVVNGNIVIDGTTYMRDSAEDKYVFL